MIRSCIDGRGGVAAERMRIAFINLDRATERRAFMEGQARRLGLAFERFEAVRAADLSDARLGAEGRAWERPISKAELACFLSHRALWTRAAEGEGPLLILEDDVVLSSRLPDVLRALDGAGDAEMVNLESFGRKRFVAARGRALTEGFALLRLHRDKAGAAAYVLWPAGGRRLVAAAEARGAAPADAFLHGLGTLRSFQVEPAVAMQVHILAAQGIATGLPVSTSVQLGRAKLPISLANLPFVRRRIATQVKLAGEHAMRLFGRRYRRVAVDPGVIDQSRS